MKKLFSAFIITLMSAFGAMAHDAKPDHETFVQGHTDIARTFGCMDKDTAIAIARAMVDEVPDLSPELKQWMSSIPECGVITSRVTWGPVVWEGANDLTVVQVILMEQNVGYAVL